MPYKRDKTKKFDPEFHTQAAGRLARLRAPLPGDEMPKARPTPTPTPTPTPMPKAPVALGPNVLPRVARTATARALEQSGDITIRQPKIIKKRK